MINKVRYLRATLHTKGASALVTNVRQAVLRFGLV